MFAMSRLCLSACLGVLLLASTVSADFRNHKYKAGDEVPVYVNTVGPYNNPTETYGYYDRLPVCRPPTIKHRIESLGEVLEGNKLITSGYDVHFLQNMDGATVCSQQMTDELRAAYTEVINDRYYFQLLLDDLPVWAFIGSTYEGRPYLLTHLHFVIEFNGERIVGANLTYLDNIEMYTELSSSSSAENIKFKYSVEWKENRAVTFDNRREHHSQHSFFPQEQEIHWFMILNSLFLVLLLTLFLFVILLRVLRNDFSRYAHASSEAGLGGDDGEDFGWKLIHGDVFRVPNHRMMLSVIVGVGVQFLVLCVTLVLFGFVGLYYPYHRGAFKSTAVAVFAITSAISGYYSGTLYKQLGGERWAWNIVLVGILVPAPLALVWCVLNSIAWYHGSTVALPFGTVVALVAIWLAVGCSLTLVGGIVGKNRAQPFDAPCRVRNIPREIPDAPWHTSLAAQMAIGGFLPFSAICMELYYVFATVWGHKTYTLYGILLIVFGILVIVTSFVSVALAYFQLSHEDYRWWWRSILNGGASAFFIYGYGIFYFVSLSGMDGVLQSSFFFGYMLIICFVFFLMMGAVGFLSTLTFVRYIYRNFKAD